MPPEEALAIVQAENRFLREQNARLRERVPTLEARLAKARHQSSKPPSSDGRATGPPRRDWRRGGSGAAPARPAVRRDSGARPASPAARVPGARPSPAPGARVRAAGGHPGRWRTSRDRTGHASARSAIRMCRRGSRRSPPTTAEARSSGACDRACAPSCCARVALPPRRGCGARG
jgi:hypothetical protein